MNTLIRQAAETTPVESIQRARSSELPTQLQLTPGESETSDSSEQDKKLVESMGSGMTAPPPPPPRPPPFCQVNAGVGKWVTEDVTSSSVTTAADEPSPGPPASVAFDIASI